MKRRPNRYHVDRALGLDLCSTADCCELSRNADGSSLGLIALLLGALYYAHLSRKRDDRLRDQEARSVKFALQAELRGIRASLISNAEVIERGEPTDFFAWDIAQHVRVMPSLLSKLVLLDVETTNAVIDIYVCFDQYRETLLLLDGKIIDKSRSDNHQVIPMRAKNMKAVAKLHRSIVERIDGVIQKLET